MLLDLLRHFNPKTFATLGDDEHARGAVRALVLTCTKEHADALARHLRSYRTQAHHLTTTPPAHRF